MRTEEQVLIAMFEALIPWYEAHKRELPWRQDREPYHVWLSEIMLQQTRVEAVKEYYRRFVTALPTIPDLAEAPEEQILKLWADWQDVWHSPHPPFFTVFCKLFVFKVLMCFMAHSSFIVVDARLFYSLRPLALPIIA